MFFFQDCYKSIPIHTDQLRCGSSTPQAAGHSIHSHIQGWGPGEWKELAVKNGQKQKTSGLLQAKYQQSASL